MLSTSTSKAGLIAFGLAVVLLFGLIFSIGRISDPSSDAEIIEDFHDKKDTLAELARLVDANFTILEVTETGVRTSVAQQYGHHDRADATSGIAPDVLAEIRRLLDDAELGKVRRSDHSSEPPTAVYFPFEADSFLLDGWEKGIAYSPEALDPLLDNLDGDVSRYSEKYAYRAIGDGWYIYVRVTS